MTEPRTTAKELAIRMAALARTIREEVLRALEDRPPSASLIQEMEALRSALVRDLSAPQFSDMFAQTICYGLFAARCGAPAGAPFSRQSAVRSIPKTSPLLARFFDPIAGPELPLQAARAVDELALLLGQAPMEAILKDFRERTGGEDPVLHFYEVFLAEYDPEARQARGVYYTPEPVVSYLVRSVDHLLKTDFALSHGLADSAKVSLPGAASAIHKVSILDPATGTGTFLHRVIDHIRGAVAANDDTWPAYVSAHLLPRLFGFELLLAPYAIAHWKLGLALSGAPFEPQGAERLNVYLMNTLEESRQSVGIGSLSRRLSEEAGSVSHFNQGSPVLVVLGNPPYAGRSENRGAWIRGLLAAYKEGCPELLKPAQSKWLSDDYVKFIRYAQWRIERAGSGILAFVTNHGYLDNPTFRGMRRSLTATFDDLYILDLHGNAKKERRAPDGRADQNVFDIQQGVAIGIFVKKEGSGGERRGVVRRADLWGDRDAKYRWLLENDVRSTAWTRLDPRPPTHLFAPEDRALLPEYEQGWPIPAIFSPGGDAAPGILTTQDELAISWTAEEAIQKVDRLLATSTEDEARRIFQLCTQDQWRYGQAKRALRSGSFRERVTRVLYRPFDLRWTVFDRHVAVHLRRRVMAHMLAGENLGLITSRLTKGEDFRHVQVTRSISEVICMSPKTSNNGFLFPLYLYELDRSADLFGPRGDRRAPRRANLSESFVRDLSARVGLMWVPDGRGDGKSTFGPEDVLAYLYAILHSRGYRERYADLLRVNFPRIPLTRDAALFAELCARGHELIAIHLLEAELPFITRYPVIGDDRVERLRYVEPRGGSEGQVWINETQYFEGVPPEVWAFEVGGYQVCRKWLKDRRAAKRRLNTDDKVHYQRIVSALSRTLGLMNEIDDAVNARSGWPLR